MRYFEYLVQPQTQGNVTEIVLNRKRYADLYLRMRGVNMDDTEAVKLAMSEHSRLLEATQATGRTWLGVFGLRQKDSEAVYRHRDRSMRLREPMTGTQEAKELYLNRALIHGMANAIDDRKGQLRKPVNWLMATTTKIGRTAFRLNIALNLLTSDQTIHGGNRPLTVAKGAVVFAWFVGRHANNFNPAEQRARDAENTFYEASQPILRIEPLPPEFFDVDLADTPHQGPVIELPPAPPKQD